MNLFKKIYWWFRSWRESLRLAAEIMREGFDRDWDENQAAEIYEHCMKQWAKAHLPLELQ